MRERVRTLREIATCLYLLGQLSWEAYVARLRAGRPLLAPTFKKRSRTLRAAALEGRALSDEPFLRPTRSADAHAPEIVALAEQCRAAASDDFEYATAIFDVVANRIDHCFDFPSRRGVVGTLERGFGTCNEKLNVFVALARAGGVPARYCTIGRRAGQSGVMSLTGGGAALLRLQTQGMKRFVVERNDSRAQRIISLLERRWTAGLLNSLPNPRRNESPHYLAEVRIGDTWIPVDPAFGVEDCAAFGTPLPRFGDEPVLLGRLMGMTITSRSEAMPYRMRPNILGVAYLVIARGVFDHINRFSARQRIRGRRILAEARSAPRMTAGRASGHRPLSV